MLHVWLSQKKTRKLPDKHNWDYSLGLWDSESLCSAKTKNSLKAFPRLKKNTNGKDYLFLLSVMFRVSWLHRCFLETLCCHFYTCELLRVKYCSSLFLASSHHTIISKLWHICILGSLVWEWTKMAAARTKIFPVKSRKRACRQEKQVRISSLQSCLLSKPFLRSLLNMFIFSCLHRISVFIFHLGG